MKRAILIISLFILIPEFSNAQWTKSLNFALTLNQSKSKTGKTGALYSKESLNYGVLVNGDLTKDTERFNWKNILKFEYSNTKSKDSDNPSANEKWTESNDKLIIDSVIRWKTSKAINLYAAGNIRTSVKNSNYINEWRAFRPLQLRESAGIGSPIISMKKQELLARTGCFAQHYANAPPDSGLYESSSGVELVFDYKNNVASNLSFSAKAGFYSNLGATKDPWNLETKSKKIKFEWDNTLIAALTKYISLNITWNIDNIDMTSDNANYEWEEKLNLALNWKVF